MQYLLAKPTTTKTHTRISFPSCSHGCADPIGGRAINSRAERIFADFPLSLQTTIIKHTATDMVYKTVKEIARDSKAGLESPA